MDKQLDVITQYGKLSALYSAVNLLQGEINKEEIKLEELQKEREEKNGQRK